MKLVDTAATTVSERQLRALRAAVGLLTDNGDHLFAATALDAIERQVRARRDGGRVVVLTRRELRGASEAWRYLTSLLESDPARYGARQHAGLRAFVALLWRL